MSIKISGKLWCSYAAYRAAQKMAVSVVANTPVVVVASPAVAAVNPVINPVAAIPAVKKPVKIAGKTQYGIADFLKIVYKKPTTMQILTKLLVLKNKTVSTDLDNFYILEQNNDSSNYLISREIAISTKSVNPAYKCADAFPADYPKLPADVAENPVEINAITIADIIDAAPYVTDDEIRQTLMYVQIMPGSIAATDGHRMYKKDVATGVSEPVYLHAETIARIKNLKPKSILIGHGKRFVIIRANNIVIFQKKMEGNFPDYKQVIGRKELFGIAITPEIRAAVDEVVGVSKPCNRKNPILRMDFTAANRQLKISYTSKEHGIHCEKILPGAEVKEDFSIGFNAIYFKAISQGQNCLTFTSSISYAYFGSIENMRLLMPLRLTDKE